MRRKELKDIVSKYPGWAKVYIPNYRGTACDMQILYGPMYIKGVEHKNIPTLNEMVLNPEMAAPCWVDLGLGEEPNYRIDIPEEWQEDYEHLPLI